jgi:hypothetical protein
MQTSLVSLVLKSENRKTGPIPVSISESSTCPPACPLRGNGCYAELGNTAIHWRRVPERGLEWPAFLAAVAALPDGQLWRHNEAGDLPGEGNYLDREMLAELVAANTGRRGFTYTHKPLRTGRDQIAIREANDRGLTINLSANNLSHADELAALGVGPVVVTLPTEATGRIRTAGGRKVVVCPAVTHGVTCAECQLCADPGRKTIIGFPAHGTRKRAASEIARGGQS